jgi:probable rRNA maturation factor
MDPGETSLLFRAIPTLLRPTAEAKRALKNFATILSKEVGGDSPFTCLVTNDDELCRLNRTFLGHDYPTDVLSFPSAEPNALGELAISIERADAQAIEYGHSCTDELKILMLHGVLHLTGLDHEQDRGEMGRAEKHWQAVLQLPPTLVARAKSGPTRKQQMHSEATR